MSSVNDDSTVATFVGSALAQLGVGHVFAVVGSGNFEVTNALIAAGVPWTTARHEGGAATMADAFSRLSDLPAVVTTHQGCGLTNAITGIGEAAKSRTPMIVLTADVAASAVRSNFRIDQDALVESVGAVSERIYSAATAEADLIRAYRRAVEDRRTVVINLPLDVQRQPMASVSAPVSVPTIARSPAAESAVLALTEAIRAARWPVFIAGRGARGAGSELMELGDLAGALLCTSAVANGLFETDDWNLGISGGFASPATAELIGGADLIVGWGSTLNMWTTRHGSLIADGATVVQVDLENGALGANRAIDLGILGDVGATALRVSEQLRQSPRSDPGYRTELVAKVVQTGVRWNDAEIDDLSTAKSIDPRVLSSALDAMLPAERVVAVDSGNFMGYPSAYLRVPDERGFCFTQAFQSIGLGLASGIGAALAQPGRLAVAACGDGGFLMSIAELETAVRNRLRMLIVVYNDAAYGAELHHFVGADMSTVSFPETDLAAIATGYGAEGVVVRTLSDLAVVDEWVTSGREVPLVVDAKVSSDGGSWWLQEAFAGH